MLPSLWVFPLQTSTKLKTWGIFILLAGILLALDLWTKYWSVDHLMGQADRQLIPGLIGLTFTRNTGAAFGLFGNFAWGRWVLTVLKIAIMAFLIFYYHKLPMERRNWVIRIPLIMIFAGGVGNLYDRVVLGYVRDMIEFLFVRFAIFNVADIFVTVGCFFLAFVLLFFRRDLLE